MKIPWVDPLIVFDREKNETTALRNILAGRPAFLVCGGPSSKALDLNQLKQRGIWTMAVNNVAGHFWPNSFVCSDPPSKFHHAIWLDPTILKMIPIQKMKSTGRGYLRQKIGDQFEELRYKGEPTRTIDVPNIWGFQRNQEWAHGDEFFTADAATWGNNNKGVFKTGCEKTMCTMLLGIRLLYHLGARTIYLIGVDFKMTEDSGYSFGQDRTPDAARNNNNQYAIINRGLCNMVENGVFAKYGLQVYNCYRDSGLRAFAYVPFEKAVEDTLTDFPRSIDLSGWYEKLEQKRD